MATRLRLLDDDAGAAVSEFVMISIPLIFMLFAVLQVAVVFYARNAVSASAADAARYAASSNMSAAAGGPRAAQEISRALSTQLGRSMSCVGTSGVDAGSGLPTTVVRCIGSIRSIFLPAGALVHIDVTARALTEPAS